MTIQYTWAFEQFDVAPAEDGLTDVVKSIHWRINAADDGYSATAYGSVGLDDTDPGSFIPFDKISEDWAVGKVSAKIDVDDIKDGLAKEIERQKSPPVVGKAAPFAVSNV